MKKYFFILLYISALLFSTAAYAQVQTKFEIAKDLYSRLAYSEAIPILEDFLNKKDNLEAKVILADCFRKNNEYVKAEEWYSKVVADKNLDDANQYLYYAQTLQTNGKYNDALNWYSLYLSKNPNDRRAKNQAEACKMVDQLKGSGDIGFVIEKLDFNTDGYDFGAALFKNKFIYTSTGGKSKDGGKINTWTGEPFMDLYSVDMDEQGNMSSSSLKWGDGINTKYNEGPLCFSAASNKVYFTRNNYNPEEKKGKKLTYSSDREANLKIYEANSNNGVWTNIKQLSFNSKDYSCGHPTLSQDGNTLYFASDMPGGFGGTDIWKADKIGESWSKPMNLGSSVNTEGDEMFPFLRENNELYFASDGLPGLGGLDIFSFTISGDGMNEPKNLGAPFNTSYDDFAYLIDNSGNYGFLSSNRLDGKGEDDIYKFVNDKYTLEVLVVDKATQLPISTAQVDLSKNEIPIQTLTTPENGTVTFKVSADSTYYLYADAHQYQPDSTLKFIEKDESKRIQKVKLELTSLLMEIQVIDAKSRQPIADAMVTVKSKCLEEAKILQTDDDGKTITQVQNDCDYNLMANAKGYIPNSKDIQIKNLNGILKVVIELKQVDELPVSLNNIYYDFDKWNIREDAEPDLKFLLLFLNTNPEARIELSSHTDSRADDTYNLKLSQKRAEAAVNWLIEHGISAKRMTAKGYGETKPVNFCVNDVKCSEEEHQKNRRTEFKVLNAGEVKTSAPKKNIKVDPCLHCPF